MSLVRVCSEFVRNVILGKKCQDSLHFVLMNSMYSWHTWLLCRQHAWLVSSTWSHFLMSIGHKPIFQMTAFLCLKRRGKLVCVFALSLVLTSALFPRKEFRLSRMKGLVAHKFIMTYAWEYRGVVLASCNVRLRGKEWDGSQEVLTSYTLKIHTPLTRRIYSYTRSTPNIWNELVCLFKRLQTVFP